MRPETQDELISVIVPIYNQSQRLDRCLSSLVGQSYPHMQIIAVDDGSTDGSAAVIADYRRRYPDKVVAAGGPNRGIGHARNQGLALAAGGIIGFVDSDDYVETDMYEAMYRVMKEQQADMVVCDTEVIEPSAASRKSVAAFKGGPVGTLEEYPQLAYMLNLGPCNKIYRRALWDGIRFPEGLKYEDIGPVLKTFARARRVGYVTRPLYDYVYSDSSQTHTYDRSILDLLTVLSDVCDYFTAAEPKVKDAISELCASELFGFTSVFYRHKDQFSDRALLMSFVEEGYVLLDGRCPGWRAIYVSHASSPANRRLRVLQTHHAAYRLYLWLRMS
mgnify:CR=1 FL=1